MAYPTVVSCTRNYWLLRLMFIRFCIGWKVIGIGMTSSFDICIDIDIIDIWALEYSHGIGIGIGSGIGIGIGIGIGQCQCQCHWQS